ncbi:MAG: hypothetical protein OXS47_08210 [Chloroflexota bacterium]|nr:hypothetical protein [Chloroflexota bacterium]
MPTHDDVALADDDVESLLLEKVKVLNQLLWEGQATRPAVDQWLQNFDGTYTSSRTERLHALYLLSKFLYFGRAEIRELLKAMFRDLVRQPLTAQAREALADRSNFKRVHQAFLQELNATRFLGLGNPSESAAYILYNFRTTNRLPIEFFPNFYELFSKALNSSDNEWVDTGVRRIIFIDDFCGTGGQAVDLSAKYLPVISQAALNSGVSVETWYLTILGTSSGLDRVRANTDFSYVDSVSELDDSYRSFGPGAQIFSSPPTGVTGSEAEGIATHYGGKLAPAHPLGYENSQLLVGFHHNVPDNSLPIFWFDEPEPLWSPIFPRVSKLSMIGA